jgi:hypothetical protein
MNATEFYQAVHGLMRQWGYPVEEAAGCWSRSNGSSWSAGLPQAAVNHHFVIGMSASFENGAQNVTYGDSVLAGPKCNHYGGLDSRTGKQRLRFISAGPANHAGQGRIEPLNRMNAGLAPAGWVAVTYSPVADNWGGGNRAYDGTEWHHPGDSTPWPDALMDLVVALNTAKCTVAGWTANRVFMHAEHSARKIDMSYHTTRGGFDLRSAVAARLSTGQPVDWWSQCWA